MNSSAAFGRDLERGNVVVAEIEARDCGPLELAEALDVTALVCLQDRARGEPYVDEVVMTAGTLAAVGGSSHDRALASLREPKRAC